MATTYTSFITALANLTVTSVARKYALNQTPPNSLKTADLPAQFIMPGGGASGAAANMGYYKPSYSATLVIAVEAISQSKAPANYSATVAMITNLNAALEAAADTIAPGDLDALEWSIKETILTIAGIDYWGVTASVSTGGH